MASTPYVNPYAQYYTSNVPSGANPLSTPGFSQYQQGNNSNSPTSSPSVDFSTLMIESVIIAILAGVVLSS